LWKASHEGIERNSVPMVIDELLVERLLNESESTTLDFKKRQYQFVQASDDEKSELLKDILAFANAFRRTDAFILIGVAEVKGARSIPVGITDEIDDASIQEFVNSKTQRPVNFCYRTVPFEGVKLGIIQIAPQERRPIYLLRDYGKLRKNVVYIRRGTSKGEASPDEIASMGGSTEERTISGVSAKVLDYMVRDANRRMDSMPSADEVIEHLGISAIDYKDAVDELVALGLVQAHGNMNHASGYASARLFPHSFIQHANRVLGIDILIEVKNVLVSLDGGGRFVQAQSVMERVKLPLPRFQVIVDFLKQEDLAEVHEGWQGDDKAYFRYGKLTPLGTRVLRGQDPMPILGEYIR
jgi:hypothetical protein